MAVEKIAEAISELTKAFQLWVTGSDKRRLRAGVDIADRIIKRYMLVTPEDKRDKTIVKWIDSFYDRIA